MVNAENASLKHKVLQKTRESERD